MRATWVVVAAALAGVVACGGSSSGTPDSASIDAPARDAREPDAMPDAMADAMADAMPDAMPDAMADAMPDATPDAVPDSMPDGMTDAMPDAMADAMPDAQTTFKIGGRVKDLLGPGLVLALDGGATVTVDQDGTFEFPGVRMTGDSYTVTIMTAPAAPVQVCTIANASGTVGTADVTDVEVTCSLGGLRINEISSCWYIFVPCWFEIANTGPLPEDLSMYALRATSVDSSVGPPVLASTFALPALSIPPGGYAIVRGRPSAGLTDGPTLVHVAAGAQVPYWQGGGFVELTRSGRTVDFVRMGTNTTLPTTTGWTGGGAPALGQSPDYSAVIVRDAASTDTDTAADWSTRAFATPGGPNDITSDADTDADGIPDQAEVPGGTFAGLDLYARGVRTNQRDLLIEIDYMPDAADPGTTPMREAIDELVAVFAPHGIAIHPDVGPLFSATPGPADYNFGGGNPVPFSQVISLGLGGAGANLYAVKMQNMDVRLQAVSHYMVFAYTLDVSATGIGELEGNDVIVALGNQGLGTTTTFQAMESIHLQAGTMFHELGHNLGLHHGGDNDLNFKPNYVSAMNYMYNTLGLPTIGTNEGDRYYAFQQPGCGGITDESQLQNPRWTATWVLDYSNGTGVPLNEASIDESKGLGRTGSGPVDFNCDGSIGTEAWDIDGDGATTGIDTDHDDWGTLELPFSHTTGGFSFVAQPWLPQFSDERRPVADETGFVMRMPRPSPWPWDERASFAALSAARLRR